MASTPLGGRTPKAAHGAPGGGPRLLVRWDRVSVLVALVAVLATVIIHTSIVAVRNSLRTTDPIPAATKAAAAPAASPEPQPQGECPRPARDIIRTAPVINGQAGEPERTVALTFDDGPGPSTPAVLDVLRQNGVPATFFVVGQNAAAEPADRKSVV